MNVSQQIINALRERGLPEIGDSAAVVIGPIVRDAIASAVRQERENIRPELYHVIIESGVGSYQVRDAIANKVDAAVRKEREAHCTIIENMAEGYKFAGHTDEAIALYDVVATLRARSEATK